MKIQYPKNSIETRTMYESRRAFVELAYHRGKVWFAEPVRLRGGAMGYANGTSADCVELTHWRVGFFNLELEVVYFHEENGTLLPFDTLAQANAFEHNNAQIRTYNATDTDDETDSRELQRMPAMPTDIRPYAELQRLRELSKKGYVELDLVAAGLRQIAFDLSEYAKQDGVYREIRLPIYNSKTGYYSYITGKNYKDQPVYMDESHVILFDHGQVWLAPDWEICGTPTLREGDHEFDLDAQFNRFPPKAPSDQFGDTLYQIKLPTVKNQDIPVELDDLDGVNTVEPDDLDGAETPDAQESSKPIDFGGLLSRFSAPESNNKKRRK